MITSNEYKILDDAYKFFNEKLFNGNLPEVLITFQRKQKAKGYFHFEIFQSREDDRVLISEIALNPNYFIEDSDLQILQTLCHEICHVAQYYLFNRPEKSGWHDEEFAEIMLKIGLMVSNTGQEGGRKTGKKMSDYIINGGKFEKYCLEFLENNKINWQNVRIPEKEKKTKERKSKLKYMCPDCEKIAWQKVESRLICGECNLEMEEQVL